MRLYEFTQTDEDILLEGMMDYLPKPVQQILRKMPGKTKTIAATIALGIAGLAHAGNEPDVIKVPSVITQAALKYCKTNGISWNENDVKQMYSLVKSNPNFGALSDDQIAEITGQLCQGIAPDINKYMKK
jgi:hypothetical protein